MRLFIYKFYKKFNYKINHLHDCVCVTSNYVDNFYEIISKIYCDSKMLNLSSILLFDRLKKKNAVSPP